ncbi:ATP-binding protein [Kitasatospora sp. DSM 101779]|uniref:ATP-binding protein n=1 Tax=Kitasatospora sp. DSM 101779 TaxID=2853165 RepID=UPI0021D85B17|nr:ATP-binding protein [Kitasatospora sp. DSM 101779]MCU7822855.1 ATP-binding protein [Kitasatospora sp. DSM 101779]
MMWIARFPGVPESVRAARRMVRDALEPSARAEDAVLIVSELVTNAVMHSRSGTGGVLWVEVRRRHGVVRVSVTDEGTAEGRPAHRPPVDAGDFGRGLRIVDALAEHWGAVGEAGGRRTVWAELAPAPGDGRAAQETGPEGPATPTEGAVTGAPGPAAGSGPRAAGVLAVPVTAVAASTPGPAPRCRLCGTALPGRQGAAVTA